MARKSFVQDKSEPSYAKAFAIAFGIHVLVAILMIVRFHTNFMQAAPAPQQQIVQAVAVSKSDLVKELARVKRANELARQMELERKLAEQKKKALAEQQRLAELQAKQQAEAEKLRLEQEAAQLKLAQELAKEQKKKVEEEHKKQAEEKVKVAEERKQQEVAEKLAAELAKQKEEQTAAEQAKEAKQAEQQRQQKKQHDSYVSSLISKYTTLVNQKISRNWMVQEQRDGIYCRLFVRVAPGGLVLDVQLTESSGSDAFDRSAVQAVYKASPLPVPTDEDAFEPFRELRLTLRPEEIISTGT